MISGLRVFEYTGNLLFSNLFALFCCLIRYN